MRFLKITCLLGAIIASTIAQASPENSVSFVKHFMDTQLTSNKSRDTRTNPVKFISRAFLDTNNLDPSAVKLDSYVVDRYVIVCSSARYVDVKIINNTCIADGSCFGDHVLRLAVISEGDHLALLPYGYSSRYSKNYIVYWWQDIKGRYELNHCN